LSYPEGGNQGVNSVKVARKQKQQRKSPLLLFILLALMRVLVRKSPETQHVSAAYVPSTLPPTFFYGIYTRIPDMYSAEQIIVIP
jgi:hypothetical protein